MNLHFLCVLSLGKTDAACFVPECLCSVTAAANKSLFCIPASKTRAMSASPPKAECCQTLLGRYRHSWQQLFGGTTSVPPPHSRDQHVSSGGTGVTTMSGKPQHLHPPPKTAQQCPSSPSGRGASFSQIPSHRTHTLSSPFLYTIPYTPILWA